MTSTRPFRLLRVKLGDEDAVDVDVVNASGDGKSSWITLVTGKNGSGKSRFLSAIAWAFDALDGRHIRNMPSIAVEYIFGERKCAFRIQGKKIVASIDGKEIDPGELPRPGTVVATTASAFDKFHLPLESRLIDANPGISRRRVVIN